MDFTRLSELLGRAERIVRENYGTETDAWYTLIKVCQELDRLIDSTHEETILP